MDALLLLLRPELTPFSLALLVVALLLVVEVVMAMVGGSIFGGDSEVDLDADADFDANLDGEMDIGDADSEFDASADSAAVASPIAGWLGFGKVPVMIWIAGVLTGFGISGYLLQLFIDGVFGRPLSAMTAVPLALLPGVYFGAKFASLIARMVPKSETTAVARRSLGNRVGVIAQGRARRGHPAQARIKDGYGNNHYVLVEPVDDSDVIGQGEEVAIMRTANGLYRAIRLTENEISTQGE